MKQVFLIFTLIIIVLAGCAPDIDFNNETILEGTYTGTYKVEKGYNTNAPVTLSNHIIWEFRANQFWCYFRPLQGEPQITCDFFGYFEFVSTNIAFKDTTVVGLCNHSYIAIGEYSQYRINDTLRYTKRYDTYDPAVRISIELVKDSK